MAVALLVSAAQAQLNIGDNTQIRLGGDAGFGYTGVFNNQDSTGLGFNFNGDLNGFYYNPNFLNFRFAPYYNQSRFNSNFNSITAAKGMTGGLNLFDGSHTPVDFSFEKSWNSEGQFNFPGSTGGGFETRGSGQGFSIGTGLLFEDYPTLRASFTKSSSDYNVLGEQTSGSSSGRSFTLSSDYELAGFRLGAGYNNVLISQDVPEVLGVAQGEAEETRQNGFQLFATRRLTDWAGWGSSFGRTHVSTDYAGRPLDSTFDSVNSNLSLNPLTRLMINTNVTYTTNASAQYLGSILTGGGTGVLAGTGTSASPAAPLTQELVSDFLTVGTHAGYAIATNLNGDMSFTHQVQNYTTNFSTTADIFSSGLGYHHSLLGGTAGAYYGLSYYRTSLEQSAIGHSVSASLSRDFWGWRNSVGAQFSRNVASALVGYTQTNYGGNISTAHRLFAGWNMSLSASASKSRVNGLTGADSLLTGYSAAFASRKLSFSGSYSRNYGESILAGNQLIPLPAPAEFLLPGIVFYGGHSYSMGAGYRPTRRLYVTASYSRVAYSTNNLNIITGSKSERLDIKSEYRFRQLDFTAGYTHFGQGIGLTFNQPVVINVVYFGISRHFDIF